VSEVTFHLGYVSEFLQKGPEIGKGQGISESCLPTTSNRRR
jgi:hypothetical protein